MFTTSELCKLGSRIPLYNPTKRGFDHFWWIPTVLWVTCSYRTPPSRSLVMDTLRQVHLKSGHTNETWHPKGDFQQWHVLTWINGIIISPVPMSPKFFKHILWSSMIYYLEVISYNLLKFHWRWGFFHIPNKSAGDVQMLNMITCTDQQKQSSNLTWTQHTAMTPMHTPLTDWRTMRVRLHHSAHPPPKKKLAKKKHHDFVSALLKVMVISEALKF